MNEGPTNTSECGESLRATRRSAPNPGTSRSVPSCASRGVHSTSDGWGSGSLPAVGDGRICALLRLLSSKFQGTVRGVRSRALVRWATLAGLLILVATPASAQPARELRPCTLIVPDGAAYLAAPDLWPGGVVYYEFDTSVGTTEQALMRDAMDAWEFSGASVSFELRTTQANFVHIADGAGNSSPVGMIGGQQAMSIFNWNYTFVMAHELGHALGLWHEHQRWDRDNYVVIQDGSPGTSQNIQPSQAHNFIIKGQGAWIASSTPYDFDSVMHYSQWAFTICPQLVQGCETILVLAPNEHWQDIMGQLDHLSVFDVQDMQAAYGTAPCAGLVILGPDHLVLNGCGSANGAYSVAASSVGLSGGEWTISMPPVAGWDAHLQQPPTGHAITLYLDCMNAQAGTYIAQLCWSGICAGQPAQVCKPVTLQLNSGCQTLEPLALVSKTSGGSPGNATSNCPQVSADGSRVAFQTQATDLAVPDANGNILDIILYDFNSGAILRLNESDGPFGVSVQANDWSSGPCISGDGQDVAFASDADNLVSDDTNGRRDIFVRHVDSFDTELVSMNSAGVQGNSSADDEPAISFDGRFIAFGNRSTNLTSPPLTSSSYHVYVRDTLLQTTTLIDVGLGGDPANAISNKPALSADGSFVAYESRATNLTAEGNPGGHSQIYVTDREKMETEVVSLSTTGALANGDCTDVTISDDGRLVVFASIANNLVAGNTDGLFVHDRLTDDTWVVNTASDGHWVNGKWPGLSGDGHYFGFTSTSGDVVVGDTNGEPDVFIRDFQSGQTVRVSVNGSGVESNGPSIQSALSADGRYVVFTSSASNFPGGPTTQQEVYRADLGPPSPISPWFHLGSGLPGVGGIPSLSATGSLIANTLNTVTLSNAAPLAPAGLFIALASMPTPFKGGTLIPGPLLIGPKLMPTDNVGARTLNFILPPGAPPGQGLWLQWAIQDLAAINGVALSNAIKGVTP